MIKGAVSCLLPVAFVLFLVLVELLQKLVEVHCNNPQEAIFPLIDFSGIFFTSLDHENEAPKLSSTYKKMTIVTDIGCISFLGSETILKGVELCEQQHLGIKLVIRYGGHMKLIQSNAESNNNLVLVLKKAKCFLQGQQHKAPESTISILLIREFDILYLHCLSSIEF
jgi:hypothetical protein